MKIIRITQNDLYQIIQESVLRTLNESQMIDEGWKNWVMAGTLGAASLFGGKTYAQDTSYCKDMNGNTQMTQNMSNEDLKWASPIYTEKELIKIFPAAYRDRNATPEIWNQNQKEYCGEITTPWNNKTKNSVVGKVAAAHGQNPWKAIKEKYLNNNEQPDK